MLQARRRANLAQEPIGSECGAQVRMRHLGGHIPSVLEIVREIHGGHAAGAELARQARAAIERRSEAFRWSGHGTRMPSGRSRVERLARRTMTQS